MKSMALSFKTSRPVHLISLLLLGLLIIAAAVCGSRGNSYGAARVADDAIMFLGGSEGGIAKYDSVEPFTAQGYPCIKVGYFGTEHTPDQLEMIPLEYFEKAIRMFKSQPEVKGKKIVVFGTSKGGEVALLLASKYKQIEGVIAKVPGSVVFQGAGPSSSWSYKDKPVPYVPFYKTSDHSKVVNNQWRELFELSLTQTDAVEKAVIKVEQINGPILILTGQKDILWPSSQMGDMIIKRLKENKFPHWYKHYAYENAGHGLNENYLFLGGTKDGNKNARIDSEKRIFAFLSRLSETKENKK
jgi:dienelactone hydrolase